MWTSRRRRRRKAIGWGVRFTQRITSWHIITIIIIICIITIARRSDWTGRMTWSTGAKMNLQSIRNKTSPTVWTRLEVTYKLLKLLLGLLQCTLTLPTSVDRVWVFGWLSTWAWVGNGPLCHLLRITLWDVNANRSCTKLLATQVATW